MAAAKTDEDGRIEGGRGDESQIQLLVKVVLADDDSVVCRHGDAKEGAGCDGGAED